jgi:Rrf2 family transcriptional regulator, iron-sulfur cluster assembly transcription factor
MLSNTCKYAIRAVIYLAINSDDKCKSVGIKKISDDLKLPAPFLGKILQSLVKSKILASCKGPNGGFSLARPAKEIKLFDVVEAIDGSAIFCACVIGIMSCSEGEIPCPINEKYAPLRDQIKVLFEEQNFEELAESVKTHKHAI